MRRISLIVALGAACTFRVDADGTFTCEDGRCPEDYECEPVSAVCFVEGTIPDAGPRPPDADLGPEGPPWWDPAWPRRHRLEINVEVGVPAGFAIGVRGGALEALLVPEGGADLRVVRHTSGGAVELDRIIDEGGAGPLWFALVEPLGPGTSNVEYYLYAGAVAAADAPADGQAIFTFYETFDVLPPTLQLDGPVSVEGGALRLDAGERVRTTAVFGAGHAVEMRPRQLVAGAPSFFGFHGDLGGFADDRPRLEWASSLGDPTHVSPEVELDDGMGVTTLMPPVLLNATARTYGVERPRDDVVVFTSPGVTSSLTQPRLADVGSLQVRAGAGATILLVEWMRVRPLVEPAPEVNVEDAETAP